MKRKLAFIIVVFSLIIRTFEEARKTDDELKSHNRDKTPQEGESEIAAYTDWHNVFASPPQAIAILGHLLLLSNEKDFSLVSPSSTFKFEYLKYPESFRTSLLQLVNIGSDAFNEAHIKMDTLKLQSININSYIKSLVEVLTEGTSEDRKYFIPKTLQKLEKIADDCIKLSADVENRFLLFMNVSREILLASTKAKGVYDEKAKETEAAIKKTKKEVERTKEEIEQFETVYTELNDDIENAKKDYTKALKEEPSSFKLFGLFMAEQTVNLITRWVFGYDPTWAGEPQPGERGGDENEALKNKAKNRAFKFAKRIHTKVESAVNIATFEKKGGKKIPNWNQIHDIRDIKHEIMEIEKQIKNDKEHTEAHDSGILICREAIKCCEKLMELGNTLNRDDNEVTKVIIDIEEVLLVAKDYLSDADANKNEYKKHTKGTQRGFGSFLVEDEILQSQFNVETAKDILNDAIRNQDDTLQNIQESEQRIEKLLNELEGTNIEKIDFEDIRKMLINGIESVAEVQHVWERIVKFFQTMSMIIKVRFHENIQNLIEDGKKGIEMEEQNGKMTDFINKQIFEELFQVAKRTDEVFTISSTYVEISNKHIVDQMSSLGRLLTLDPKENKDRVELERQELLKQSKSAVTDIKNITKNKRIEFFERFETTKALFQKPRK